MAETVAEVVLRKPIQSRARSRIAPRLCGYPEEALDELRLPHHILSIDPFQLPLAHPVQSLNAFYHSFSGVKRAEALRRSPTPPDGSVVLFDHVIEILDAPELAIEGKNFLFH